MTRVLLDYPVGKEKRIAVEGAELRYLTRVRRHKQGDEVEVRDSEGRRFSATVAIADRESAMLDIGEELDPANAVWPLDIIVAQPKGTLMDDVVRKLSELGARSLVPAICERSQVRPGDARLERWRRIARESSRQCGRDAALEVERALALDAALDTPLDAELKLILHPRSSSFPFGPGGWTRPGSICVAVGPEGGFTEAEVENAVSKGFEPVGFGSSIMRIETAAVAAAVLSVALLGGFGARREG